MRHFDEEDLMRRLDEKIAELGGNDPDDEFDFDFDILGIGGEKSNELDIFDEDEDDVPYTGVGQIFTKTGKLELPYDIRLLRLPCMVKIKSKGTTTDALLTEQYCKCSDYISLDSVYHFSLLKMDDEIYVANFKPYIKEPFEFGKTEAPYGRKGEKPFISNINDKYGKRVRIGIEIEGELADLQTKDGVEYFNIITYDKNTYRCVLDGSLMPWAKIKDLKSGRLYRFKGLMDNGVFYVMHKGTNWYEEFIKRNYSPDEQEDMKSLLKSLDDEQQEYIISIVEEASPYEIAKSGKDRLFSDYRDLKTKYMLCKKLYPPEIQQEIEKCIAEIDFPGFSDKVVKKVFSFLVNTDWNRELSFNADPEYIRERLDETHYGMDALKEELITLITTNEEKTEKRGAIILINGPSGVGKTSLVQRFAEICGLPYMRRRLNGINTPTFLAGTPRLYDNAFPGVIARTIQKKGLRSIIILDEIDNMCQGTEGDPYTSLYDLFDSDGMFEDQFLEAEIDMSDTIFILTSNNTENIPAPILNRCEIINIDGYSEEEKFKIAKDYIIPKTLEMYNLSSDDVCFDDDAINDLSNRYNITDGVREIERSVLRIVKNIIRTRKLNGHEKQITVTSENLQNILKLPPCSSDKIAHTKAELENKFKYFHYRYSADVRAKIKALFAEYANNKSDAEKEMTLKSLFYLVNILPEHNDKEYDLEKIKREMDASHYGLSEVKEQILMNLAARNVSGEGSGKCILLDGMCGIGKTSICKTLARAMGKRFAKISLNGVSHPEYIKGYSRTIIKSEAGAIIKHLAEQRKFILLDEIDKMSTHNGEDPYAALLDLLDDSKQFTDNYLGIPIDLSDVFIIATSNYIDRIPEAVLDRMKVIELGGYEKSEKGEILRTHIIPKQLKRYNAEDKISFSDEAIKLLSDKYCPSYGMRDTDTAVGKIMEKLILEKYDSMERVEVTPAEVKRILGAAPMERGNVSKKKRPGIARALAVSGNRGTTFAIQVTDKPYGKDEITGLPKQSTLDSVSIAKLLVSKYINKELPPMHIHFGEGGIEKDGPSAGITIVSAIFSYVLRAPIDPHTAFTGEIDIYGDVWAIGGINLKIKAAINEGCNRVFIPYDNYVQLEDDGDLDKYDIEIVPIQSVYELAEMLFGNKFVGVKK